MPVFARADFGAEYSLGSAWFRFLTMLVLYMFLSGCGHALLLLRGLEDARHIRSTYYYR